MRTLIITGGSVHTGFLENLYQENSYDYCIGVDGGADYAYRASIEPNMVLGDFDSASSEVVDYYRHNEAIEVRSFPVKKDETDTHLALLEALNIGSTKIDIIGGIGSRMDHTLANIHIMKLCLEVGVSCRIIDQCNIISLIDGEAVLYKSDYPYTSLIPLTTEVEGITTEGMKYPLHDYTMKQGISVGISNELIEDRGSITLTKGVLIMIQSKDLE